MLPVFAFSGVFLTKKEDVLPDGKDFGLPEERPPRVVQLGKSEHISLRQ